MITYNPAFDLYHCIYRISHILQKLDDNESIEVDKLRIWDFYLLYPSKVYSISLKRNEDKIRDLRKQCIRQENNPYEYSGSNRKLFEIISPYQMTALNCLIACGILDKAHFENKEIYVSNHDLLNSLIHNTGELTNKERNALSFMSYLSKNMTLLGLDGLKARTRLMESKYDAK